MRPPLARLNHSGSAASFSAPLRRRTNGRPRSQRPNNPGSARNSANGSCRERLLDHADAAARFVGAACVDTTAIALWLGIGEAVEILTAMWLTQIGRPMRGPDSSFFPLILNSHLHVGNAAPPGEALNGAGRGAHRSALKWRTLLTAPSFGPIARPSRIARTPSILHDPSTRFFLERRAHLRHALARIHLGWALAFCCAWTRPIARVNQP
jgi:hypothetical protein